MRNILFFILICMFQACTNMKEGRENGDLWFKPKKELTFDVGFPVTRKHTDTYISGGQELICFADVSTNKIIHFFTLDGKKQGSIPLDCVIDDGHEIDDFSIVSPDTILVNTLYSNKIYILNRKGECLERIDLDKVVKHENGDQFEFYSSAFQDFYSNGSVILGCSYRDNIKEQAPTDALENLRYFYSKMFRSPYFLKIDNIFSDSLSYSVGPEAFYHKYVSDTGYVIVESSFYHHDNNRLFCFSAYSDKIFEVGINDLEVKTEIRVKSDHSSLGADPIPLNNETVGLLQEKVNEALQTSGIITRLHYDRYRKLYYVMVYHDVPGGKGAYKNGERPWSLLVYDEQFNKKWETKFDEKEFIGGNILVCKEGLLVSNNVKSREDYDRKKARYMLFQVGE